MEKERYFLDGPGETLVVMSDFDLATPDPAKIIAVISSKRGAFTFGVTEEKVTGGRGLVPRRKFMTERNITFELEDCETDFRYFNLSQGITPVTGATDVWAYGSDYRYAFATGALAFDLGETPLADTLMVKNAETGLVMAYSTVVPAGATLQLTGSTLTADASQAGVEIECMFKYTAAATAITSSMKMDDVPKTVKLIHTQVMFDEDNNKLGKQQIEVFKAQTSAEFNEQYQERQAFAPVVKFEVLDPRRPDKKVLDKKLIVV